LRDSSINGSLSVEHPHSAIGVISMSQRI
jgi:hypothetical protein